MILPTWRQITAVVLFGGCTLMAAELLVRLTAGPELGFRRAERALHCVDYETGYVLLCPSQTIDFNHPAGFSYRVTTNSRGERTAYPDQQPAPGTAAQSARRREVVDSNDPATHKPEIWIIGDSIAMGFGNDDRSILAYRLARAMPGYHIRNLGVDSLGACGIQQIFERALARASESAQPGATTAAGPRHTIWILNPSDYSDDIRDRRLQASSTRRVLFLVRHWFTRRFALPDFLRLQFVGSNPLIAPGLPARAATAPVDPEHPTFQCTRAIFRQADRKFREAGSRFTLLVYPDIDRQTGGPLRNDPLKAPIIALARKFAATEVLDLQSSFERRRISDLYLPEDGHPGPGSQRLFDLGVQSILD